MEPQQNPVETIIAPLKKVTPLSKYLAMTLFVLLPFIGGWIGYQYSPEKIVEVEKTVVQEDKTETVMLVRKSIMTDEKCPLDKEKSEGYTIQYNQDSNPTVCYKGMLLSTSKSFMPIYYTGLDNISVHGTSTSDLTRFARDDEGFYVDDEMVYTAEDNTYAAYEDHYFRIDSTIYYQVTFSGDLTVLALESADALSFTTLGNGYAKTKDDIFYQTKKLGLGQTDGFRLVAVKYDRSEFLVPGEIVLGIDQGGSSTGQVFHNGQLLQGIDPNNFTVAPEAEYIRDEDTIWYDAGKCNDDNYTEGSLEDINKKLYRC